jgi:FKBP-type peptidyl-prolyl cis-trans isomerase
MGIAQAEGKVDKRNEPKADVSYALGMAFGDDLKGTGLKIDYDHFMEGFRASMEDEGTKLTVDEAIELIQGEFLAMQQLKMAEDLEKGREFLKNNATKEGVRVTASGLQYTIIEEGDGEKPVETDKVRVHYEGSLIDGTVFDSSLERGVPVDFPLDAVIPGWSEGLQLMTIGSHYKLYLPSELGYGEWGAGDIIPPNSALIFDVQLLDIVRDDESDEEEIPAEPFLPDDEGVVEDNIGAEDGKPLSPPDDESAVEDNIGTDEGGGELILTDDVTAEETDADAE